MVPVSFWGFLSSDLLTWYLGNVSAFWAFEGGCDRIMYLQFGAGELCMSLVQGRAESLENSRSMRRTERGQRDTELILGGFELGGSLDGGLNTRASFLL